MNRKLYLDLMVKCLTNSIYEDPAIDPWSNNSYVSEKRTNGLDWPQKAHTMIGTKRLKNIQQLAEIIIRDNIPGDFIETGVWRGGATIFMRAILKAYDITDKIVWVADSFEGLPKPNTVLYQQDKDDIHHTYTELSIPLEEVQDNFKKYDLLDDQVKFLKGWFKDTLPNAPIKNLSLLRLDGDMYESTMDGLESLYDKLSPGGFLIFDDATLIPGSNAVKDFRKKYNINNEIHITEDRAGIFWRK